MVRDHFIPTFFGFCLSSTRVRPLFLVWLPPLRTWITHLLQHVLHSFNSMSSIWAFVSVGGGVHSRCGGLFFGGRITRLSDELKLFKHV